MAPPGPLWVGKTRDASFAIVGGALRYQPKTDNVQDVLWHTTAVQSLDQWLCFRLKAIVGSVKAAVGVALRGASATAPGSYIAISGHTAGNYNFAPTALFEGFSGIASMGAAGGERQVMGGGYAAGDWLCASLRGTGAQTVAQIWKLSGDPGTDPVALPTPDDDDDTSWSGLPGIDDTEGVHLGIGFWPLTSSSGDYIDLDDVRGGALP